ncbi:metallophosphoesterase [Aliamphritea spongicola]|uniref:metallophosphoesterase n=1 Tax=Aliamphritea spongicola TaxID=707589 RepID=UPI00196B666E|nr:metallophosphoesterase [Aliamphritea spongicola]MBN3563289.1 metallophosphoesterase [Aliamphritea spongicola]
MARLRIVQLSDIHLTPSPGEELYGVDTGESLSAAINSIQHLQPAPDLILVTGDISEDGSLKSYQRFANCMTPLSCPVSVLPGNHDLPDNMAEAFSATPQISFQQAIHIQGWHVLLLDSHVPGEEFGKLNTSRLERLRQQLQTAGEAPVLVALHHTPGKVCPSSGCQLHNPDALLNILKDAPNTQAVVAGHTHNDSDQTVNGVRVLTCPSTFAYAQHAQPEDNVDHEDFWAAHQLDISRQGYRIIDLDDAHITSTQIIWF